jgi:tRNA (guanine37-N1)-methyltransferase
MFKAITDFGITGRAIERQLLTLRYWNPRDYTADKHKRVDDRPYGGGPGMVMQAVPLSAAIQAARLERPNAKVIYLSPQGRKLDQQAICALAKENEFIFLAGRYEGVDERLLALEVDEEWSVGDYVLSGGELGVMVMIDAMTRWLPGSVGNENSIDQDSFANGGLLDCPHFTRPEVFEGMQVPEVLLGGNHKQIARWRLKQQLGRTWERRKDLLAGIELEGSAQALLEEFIEAYTKGKASWV